MGAKSERIEFKGGLHERLSARLEQPAGETVAYALFAHCFTCSKDLKATRRISRAMAERGIGVLRFDFTGIGESEGDFAETDFSSNVQDLVAAAQFLRENYFGPQLLVGHSLGGAAALVAAGRIEEIRAVATIAAPSHTDALQKLLVEKAPDLEETGRAQVDLGGRTFWIHRRLLDDLAEHSITEAARDLKKPLMIFHSPLDNVVGIDHARRIFEAAKHPKSFVSLDDADHLLIKNEGDAQFLGYVLAAWASRYLRGEGFDDGPAQAASRDEVITEGASSGYLQHLQAGGHRMIADEPAEVGGTDAGPTPYQLLLAGLGACTGMTLRMYADRKGWPLDRVGVRLKHRRIHAEDCSDCETAEGKIDVIERVLDMRGSLSEDQRQRLLEIADRCPVSRTLTSETKVRTRLLGDAGESDATHE